MSCGVQPNGDTKADLLQTDVAKLTFEEGRVVLFESAKAAIGTAKVQQICEAIVQIFFFKTNVAAHASLSLFEDFERVLVVPDHHDAQYILMLQVPNIDSKELRTILTSYRTLFEWEMSMRGFRFTAIGWGGPDIKVGHWEIEHL